MIQRRRHGKSRGLKPSRLRRPKSYKVACWGCGKEIVVQVPPPDDKRLLCIDCFKKEKNEEEDQSK